jgi:dienelactone hydrolase
MESYCRTAVLLFSLLACACGGPAVGEESSGAADLKSLVGKSFPTKDSLDPGDESDADARDCLDGLCWQPASFSAACEQSPGADRGDVLVRFPTAVVSGDPVNDRVAMEWYVARDEHGQPRRARAVVVIHESGSGMHVGRVFARGLRELGLHAFMLHLPYYGERRTDGNRPKDGRLIPMMQQAIADVRRGRDAVAVLPWVDSSHIALQGTSLGGFVSATAAGLDHGYDSVYLMLAGGRLYDVIQNGQKDAAKVREELAKAGLSGEKLKSLAWKIEPTRLAHRINADTTWLYSGVFDTVVPQVSAKALADAAGLDDQHHLQLLANHYTGIIYLPMVLNQIRENVNR